MPREPGGLGATMRQVVVAEEELGSWSGAAALAAAMHLHLTLVQKWRLRCGDRAAAGRRERPGDVHERWFGLGVPDDHGRRGRGRLPPGRPQGVLHPGPGRGRDLHLRRTREPRPGRGRAARGGAAVGSGCADRRDLGHAAGDAAGRAGAGRRAADRGDAGAAACRAVGAAGRRRRDRRRPGGRRGHARHRHDRETARGRRGRRGPPTRLLSPRPAPRWPATRSRPCRSRTAPA